MGVAMETRNRWFELCHSINSLPEVNVHEIWTIIESKYSESHRYYHTLTHILSLLKLSEQHKQQLTDPIAVDLAIFFHDIIYNPQASDNEEQSAQLCEELMNDYISSDMMKKVYDYIISTKQHVVQSSSDYDLKLFIDMDMSILAAPAPVYQEYAKNVRLEYIHVAVDAYCKGRGKFLSSLLHGHQDRSALVFATEEFSHHTEQLIENLTWECALLATGITPLDKPDTLI